MPNDASLAVTFVVNFNDTVEDFVNGEELLIAGNLANASVEYGELVSQLQQPIRATETIEGAVLVSQQARSSVEELLEVERALIKGSVKRAASCWLVSGT